MTGIKLSKHCTEERLDRLVHISMTIGFGEVILTNITADHKRECLTDTGVVLIMDLYDDFLITAYIIDIGRLTAMYLSHGYDRVPTKIARKVVKNMKKNIYQDSRKRA
jgi:hypothetical protein